MGLIPPNCNQLTDQTSFNRHNSPRIKWNKNHFLTQPSPWDKLTLPPVRASIDKNVMSHRANLRVRVRKVYTRNMVRGLRVRGLGVRIILQVPTQKSQLPTSHNRPPKRLQPPTSKVTSAQICLFFYFQSSLECISHTWRINSFFWWCRLSSLNFSNLALDCQEITIFWVF